MIYIEIIDLSLIFGISDHVLVFCVKNIKYITLMYEARKERVLQID